MKKQNQAKKQNRFRQLSAATVYGFWCVGMSLGVYGLKLLILPNTNSAQQNAQTVRGFCLAIVGVVLVVAAPFIDFLNTGT